MCKLPMRKYVIKYKKKLNTACLSLFAALARFLTLVVSKVKCKQSLEERLELSK